jgi:glutamyl-tRNA synthetase
MPVRICLTGRMQGPDIGSVLELLKEGESTGIVTSKGGLVPLAQRIQMLKDVDWSAIPQEASAPAESPILTH